MPAGGSRSDLTTARGTTGAADLTSPPSCLPDSPGPPSPAEGPDGRNATPLVTPDAWLLEVLADHAPRCGDPEGLPVPPPRPEEILAEAHSIIGCAALRACCSCPEADSCPDSLCWTRGKSA